MALVTMPNPIAWPGITGYYSGGLFLTTAATLSSVGHYYCYVFVAKEDMTVSHVGVRCGTATGSPTITFSIETVDTSTGLPTGTLWATKTSGTSGTVTSNTYVLQALTASASITRGQVFAVKIALASGTSQLISGWQGQSSWQLRSNLPYLVNNTGTPAKAIWQDMMGSLALGSSSTTFYQIPNCIPGTAGATNTFNNTNSAKRGLLFTPPMNCRAIGIRWLNNTAVGDYNAGLYDNSGTELSSSSTAFDGDLTAASTSGAYHTVYFDSAVTLTAGTAYRVAIEPTSATNVNVSTLTLPSANYRSASPAGTMAQYTTFASAAWDDTNTSVLPIMDLIIDQVDNGAGSGGGVVGVIGG